MKRRIIQINADLCNGCGACANACHEGAIGMRDGKAVLLREDYCDGLGDCLPTCPTGAITFVEREAAAYDEKAVAAAKAAAGQAHAGCPGTRLRQRTAVSDAPPASAGGEALSQLRQWPCQLRLVPVNAPFFEGADLLIAADCTAFAYASMHDRLMRGRVTLIGCPKLDDADYTEKLTAIFRERNIRSVTVARMEVPCCGGLDAAVRRALAQSQKPIPVQTVVISVDGTRLK